MRSDKSTLFVTKLLLDEITIHLQGAAFNVTHFKSRIAYLFYTAINTTEHGQVSVDKKNQLDVTFCIIYFSSNSSSTCFGQPCAHHQELTTA